MMRVVVWIGLGEKSRAVEELEKAYLGRESSVAIVKVMSLFDSLRSEPGFKALFKKMDLDV